MGRAAAAGILAWMAMMALIAASVGWWFQYPLAWGGTALGPGVVYWPWAHLTWWSSVAPDDRWALVVAYVASLGALAAAARLAHDLSGAPKPPGFGGDRWATGQDLKRRGLL